MEYQTPTGATIRWSDDDYIGKSQSELQARENHMNNVASVLAQKVICNQRLQRKVD